MKLKQRDASVVIIGRNADAAAQSVGFLASYDVSFITGQERPAAGGRRHFAVLSSPNHHEYTR